LEIETSHNTL